MTRAVLFKSVRRHESFAHELRAAGCEVVPLDFAEPAWRSFDFSTVDIVVFIPSTSSCL